MAKDRRAPPAGTSGKPTGLKVRESSKNDDRDIELLTDESGLEGYVQVVFHASQSKVTADEILSFLFAQKVVVSDEGRVAIAKAIDKIGEGSGAIGPLLVAKGKPAVNGQDGQIEWLVPRPDLAGQQKATVGRVDYRETNQIINVRQGQKILLLAEPSKGEAGQDIFGNNISCQPGRPANIRRGKNVDVTPDGKEFFAQVSGMLQSSGESVLVEPMLVIQNDVDMSVGNIHFIGPVKVNRDVHDGFTIKAGREIEIGGMVEGSNLESGSSVKVQGGIAGKGRAHIVCKGNLEAKYLSDVAVEAGGDVLIANSIVNATVKSLGKIVVNTGGIRGANVIAHKGLKSPEIGSELGVRTIVVVGVDYHLKDKLITTERELSIMREAVEKIEGALGPLLADGEVISTLAPEKAEIARRLMGQLDLLVQRGDELAAKHSAMIAKMQVGSEMFIEVSKKIFAGVAMQIGTCRRTFELDVTGPVKLYPDIENGSVKVTR